jgi:hypothetical protein
LELACHQRANFLRAPRHALLATFQNSAKR